MSKRRTVYKFTTESERRLREMRQSAGTVYHQLLAQGFTRDDIVAEVDSTPGTRRIGLAMNSQDGSDLPLIGVSYGGDFRSEEESGIPEIATALRNDEHASRIVTGDIEGHWFLALHADRGLDSWKPEQRLEERAEAALRRSRDVARDEFWRDKWLKIPELRDLIRGAGIDGPLPRKKSELQDVLTTKVRKKHVLANVGEFHFGDTLIMLPARPVITAALRILAESGKHLRMSGSSTPFGRGATLYDERDLTGDTVEQFRALEAYTRRQDQKAETTRRALRQQGSLWALSSPTRRDGRDLFWLNYSPRGHRQVSGWFTLAELNEKLRTGDWPSAT